MDVIKYKIGRAPALDQVAGPRPGPCLSRGDRPGSQLGTRLEVAIKLIWSRYGSYK